MKKKPLYSFELAKQLIFEVAMEIMYKQSNIPDDVLANKLLSIIEEMDKMKVVD